jgi:hypothetical protein
MIEAIVGFAAVGAADLVGNLARREGWPKPRPGRPNAADAPAMIAADLEGSAGLLQLVQRWKLGPE